MKHATANAMSLRAKINTYAKEHGILAQVVLQNYMFECLLDRISRSKYVDNFVIKGGILVSSLVGLDVRSTMDMDTTLVHLSLTEEKIKEAGVDGFIKMSDRLTLVIKGDAEEVEKVLFGTNAD